MYRVKKTVLEQHARNISAQQSRKPASLPSNLRHELPKEVLASLPIRPLPSKRSTRKRNSFVKPQSSLADPSSSLQAGPSSGQAGPSSSLQTGLSSSSQAGPSSSIISKHDKALAKYQRQCISDIDRGSELHKTSFRGKEYYVVALAVESSEQLDAFENPPISFRRKISAKNEEKFEDHIRESGPSDKFGAISIIHNQDLKGIIVDGKRRHSAYMTLMKEKSLGIGDVNPKIPDDFQWYRKYLTTRLFIPVSLLPPTDAEMLSLPVALNGDINDSTPLSEADIYVMLQNFVLYACGPKIHRVEYYVCQLSKIVEKAIDAKLLDHFFDRHTRERIEQIENSAAKKKGPKSKLTPEENNRKQVYSRYIRASISFFNQGSAFKLVFNNFGYKCPLWCKELLCYEKFVEMEEIEMTVSLALLAKRYNERRRKEAFNMTPAEAKKVINLVMDILDVVKSVAKDKKALSSSDWNHWLGARLQNHKDKRVAKHPYIYSLAFFVYKWNEKGVWKKDVILKEVKHDRLQWPANRKWRGQTFELKDFDESFFTTELLIRTQSDKKRKRQSPDASRPKRQCTAQKQYLGEESEECYEHEDGEISDVQPGQVEQTTSNKDVASVEQREDTVRNDAAVTPSSRTDQRDTGYSDGSTLTAPINRKLATSSVKDTPTNDSAQLSHFMNFVLKKAGVQNTSNIDVTSLLKAESSEFIDRIIQNLQQYGTSSDHQQKPHVSIGEKGANTIQAVSGYAEIQDDEEDDDYDKELLEKAKTIWITLEKRFSEESHQDVLPEPCQGMGLWGKMLLPGCIVEIKEDVRKAIFRSRQMEYNVNDSMNQRFINMFKDMRSMELKYQGFTICEGFLTGGRLEDWVNSFLSYYMKYFTGKDGNGSERTETPCPWESIANVGAEDDTEPLKKGIGRYQVSSIADVLYLTQHELELYNKKLMLEVFVAELMCNIVSSADNPLRFPSFGSKLLVHTPEAKAQRIHCDYSVRNDGVLEESEVKYFSIVTGKLSSYLHVLPMGHLEISRRGGKVSNVTSKLIELPPYSVGIFRGDLPHAGSGADDDVQRRGKFEFAPRIHFYVDRPKDRDKLVMEPTRLFYPH